MIEMFWENFRKNKTTQIAVAISAAFLIAALLLLVALSTELSVVKEDSPKTVSVASVERQIEEAGKQYRKGHFEKAIKGFNKVILEQPKNAEIYFMLGNAHQGTGNWKAAVSSYERAVELDARMIKARYQLGLAYVKLGDNSSASECLKECVKQAPDLGGARLALAKIYTDEGKFDEAIEQYTTLLEMNLYGMSLVRLHNDLGLLYVRKGNVEQAKAEWEKALQIEPQNSRAKELLAEYQ